MLQRNLIVGTDSRVHHHELEGARWISRIGSSFQSRLPTELWLKIDSYLDDAEKPRLLYFMEPKYSYELFRHSRKKGVFRELQLAECIMCWRECLKKEDEHTLSDDFLESFGEMGYCYLDMFDLTFGQIAYTVLGRFPQVFDLVEFVLALQVISEFDWSVVYFHECLFNKTDDSIWHCQTSDETEYIENGDFIITGNYVMFVDSDRHLLTERKRRSQMVIKRMKGVIGSDLGSLFDDFEEKNGMRKKNEPEPLDIKSEKSSVRPSESASNVGSSEISVKNILHMYNELHDEKTRLESELASMSGCRERLHTLWHTREEMQMDLSEAIHSSGTRLLPNRQRIVDPMPELNGNDLVIKHTSDERLNFLISLHVTLFEILSEDGDYPCVDFMERMVGILTEKEIWEKYDSQYLDLLLIVLNDTFDFSRSRIKNNSFCLPGLEPGLRISENLIGECLLSLASEYRTRWRNLFKDVKLPDFVNNRRWGSKTVTTRKGKMHSLEWNWKRVQKQKKKEKEVEFLSDSESVCTVLNISKSPKSRSSHRKRR